MASVLFCAKQPDNIIEGYSKEKERLVFAKPVLAKGRTELRIGVCLRPNEHVVTVKSGIGQ